MQVSRIRKMASDLLWVLRLLTCGPFHKKVVFAQSASNENTPRTNDPTASPTEGWSHTWGP